jgi:hypothetical protein
MWGWSWHVRNYIWSQVDLLCLHCSKNRVFGHAFFSLNYKSSPTYTAAIFLDTPTWLIAFKNSTSNYKSNGMEGLNCQHYVILTCHLISIPKLSSAGCWWWEVGTRSNNNKKRLRLKAPTANLLRISRHNPHNQRIETSSRMHKKISVAWKAFVPTKNADTCIGPHRSWVSKHTDKFAIPTSTTI